METNIKMFKNLWHACLYNCKPNVMAEMQAGGYHWVMVSGPAFLYIFAPPVYSCSSRLERSFVALVNIIFTRELSLPYPYVRPVRPEP